VTITAIDMFKPPAAQGGPGGWVVVVSTDDWAPVIWYEKDHATPVDAESALTSMVCSAL
jgi:hypothetical protein